MRVRTVSLSVLMAALALTTIGHATTSAASSHALPAQSPAGFLANSTQAVCALTGDHGNLYKELPTDYTDSQYGLIAGDSGSSFEYNGQVWWLFGNTDAYHGAPWGKSNEKSRWPKVKQFNSAAGQGSDSMAWSSEATQAPAPAVPYTGTMPSPNQQCPILNFVTRTPSPLHVGPAPAEAYINPSVFPDPYFTTGPHATTTKYYVSLRRGELPEAGIEEGGKMYVVFGTDNPANCENDVTILPGPCVSPTSGVSEPCGRGSKGSRTRSVMAVYQNDGKFEGLYDLSAPGSRFAPLCQQAWAFDDARFVNVQMANGNDGFIYIWGTEGGSNDSDSPIFLARVPAAQIANKSSLQYWNGTAFVTGPSNDPEVVAEPLISDSPQVCASQLGIQYNQYLNEWILLYRCNESPPPKGRPNGIYMRTAPNPWGPWSAPTTIFDPAADSMTKSGFCYFIYTKNTPLCTKLGQNESSIADSKTEPQPGGDYGPYIVANWTTGSSATDVTQARSTIYYTLDTFDPYGQLIMRSTILGPPVSPPCTKNCA